jgi:AGZA family xanthine/uracil permease-like MFS transporter
VLGLRNAKIIAASTEKTALSFGNLSDPVVVLAVIGFVILLILEARRVRGSALGAILLATLIGIPLGVTKIPATLFTMPAGIGDVAFRFNILGALNVKYVPFLFAFFLPDFFSSLGTALGVGSKAGFLDKNGDLPGLNKVFLVDSVAATVGSLFSIPILITYLESGAGVEAGGRTGLTAITTAVAFLLVLFITPIALMIPAAATAPVLIYVGISMLSGMRGIDYSDMAEYIPAFLCIALTVFTFNIGNGISAAFIAYVIIKVSAGRYKELAYGHYLLSLLLMYYFFSLTNMK